MPSSQKKDRAYTTARGAHDGPVWHSNDREV